MKNKKKKNWEQQMQYTVECTCTASKALSTMAMLYFYNHTIISYENNWYFYKPVFTHLSLTFCFHVINRLLTLKCTSSNE